MRLGPSLLPQDKVNLSRSEHRLAAAGATMPAAEARRVRVNINQLQVHGVDGGSGGKLDNETFRRQLAQSLRESLVVEPGERRLHVARVEGDRGLAHAASSAEIAQRVAATVTKAMKPSRKERA